MREKFNFILMILISVLIMLFLDASAGFYLTATLILAIIVSIAITIIYYKNVEIIVKTSNPVLNKDDTVCFQINLIKPTFLPSPFIEIKLDSDGKLVAVENLVCLIFPNFDKSKEIKYDFNAKYCGKSEIRISSIIVKDFMGLLMLKIPIQEDMKCKIKIFPQIYNISDNDLLLGCVKSNSYFTDSEETSQNNSITLGLPGYEHRLYIPGDPLKKVNWKMSAKRDNTYVRLNESPCNTRQIIILDNTAYSPECDCMAVEAMFSFIIKLIKNEIPSTLMIMHNNIWEKINIDTQADIDIVCDYISEYTNSTGKRIPEINSTEKDEIITIFTSLNDSDLQVKTQELKNNGYNPVIISSSPSISSNYTINISDKTVAFGKEADSWQTR